MSMTTLADIRDALAAILEDTPNVDSTAVNNYYPLIQTQRIGMVLPPFRLRSQYVFNQPRSDDLPDYHSHRITVEFWCKDIGDPARTVADAVAVGQDAVTLLLQNQAFAVGGSTAYLGYLENGTIDYAIDVEVGEDFVVPTQGGIPYVVATLSVPVHVFE